jgi:urease subunit alpha
MFGAMGLAAARTSVSFTSQAALDAGVPGSLGLTRELVACKNTRDIRKSDMVHNTWLPEIEVDPQTYEVRADGELLTCEPATELPLAQLYSLF